jgi:hypothetical protein
MREATRIADFSPLPNHNSANAGGDTHIRLIGTRISIECVDRHCNLEFGVLWLFPLTVVPSHHTTWLLAGIYRPVCSQGFRRQTDFTVHRLLFLVAHPGIVLVLVLV